MPDTILHFDWAAGAPPDPEIAETCARIAVDYPGNPSSRHELGRKAAGLLADCRSRCAAALKVEPSTVVFTSGATESNALVAFAELHRGGRGHLVVSEREHSSMARPVKQLARFGFDVTTVSADENGRIGPEQIIGAIRDDTVFVASTLVASETGAVFDVAAITDYIRVLNSRRKRKIHHHCDCVQALGKIPFSIDEIGADTASFSGHKIAGPRGAGILYAGRHIEPLVVGGGQEKDLRPGTENLPAIYGMTLAMERYADDVDVSRAQALCRMLLEGIAETPNGRVSQPDRTAELSDGRVGGYSPYIVQAGFPPIPGEVLARVLSDRGVAVSMGSACASNLPEEVKTRNAVRFSFGYTTSEADVSALLEALAAEVSTLAKVLG
jgi:cysteine desulfurase